MIHYPDRWAVVTGASSGLGRGLAARLADRGMSVVLTGRNEARLDEAAQQIRRAAPSVQVETVTADLSTPSGVSKLLDRVGDCPIEVLINNAGFGSYGPFAQADLDCEAEEVAVDVSAVIALAHAFLPDMIARRSVGFSTSRPRLRSSPRRRSGGVRGEQGVRALVQRSPVGRGACGRRGGHRTLSGSDPDGFRRRARRRRRPHRDLQPARHSEPVIDAGLRALDKGRAVVIPGARTKVIAAAYRFMPREWLTLVAARLLRPVGTASRPPIEVRNETVIRASAERVWDLLTDVERWPSWYRACRWVRVESTGRRGPSGVLPVEGTPGRAAQHRGGQPIDRIRFAIRRGRRGAARRAHVHDPPRARRPEHRRRQPRNPGRAAPVAGPACSWRRGCMRPTRRCSTIWPEPPAVRRCGDAGSSNATFAESCHDAGDGG